MNEELTSEQQKALDAMRPAWKITASDHFKERVMQAISEENARANARKWTWSWKPWVPIAVAAALILVAVPMFRTPTSGSSSAALFAQSIDALAKTTSVHIVGRVRTLPGDNFDLVGPNYDFVPFEIWREYSNPPKWRIEKPGRVVVMNGQSSLLYISKTNTAMSGTPRAGFVQWMRPLLDPQSILEQELQAAKSHPDARVTEANNSTDVSIRRPAGGNYANDWARNKSIDDSDHTTAYRFDSTTKRLEGLRVDIHASGQTTTVLELTDIRYNESIPAASFALELPADVIWSGDAPARSALSFNGPKEAAEFFFRSCGQEDWDAVLNVYPDRRVSEIVKDVYGGLQVIRLGEPFQSGLYPGWFVPYEIRLRNGRVKSHKIALRNDNKAKRWLVDGGF